MNSTERYLRALFKPGEFLCYTNSPFAPEDAGSFEEALALEPRQYVSVNPLVSFDRITGKQQPHRRDCNVLALRSFVIEMDKEPGTEEPIPVDEQLLEVYDKGCPFNTVTHSGGKSIHTIVTLTEPVDSDEYEELFKLINFVFWRLDSSCKNPSRLTRVGGAIRDGKEQELIGIGAAVSKITLKLWLARFDRHIQRCKAREAESITKFAAGADGEAVTPWALAFLSGKARTKSSRHNALFACARQLARRGDGLEEATEAIFDGARNQGIDGRDGEINRLIIDAFRAEGRS